MPPVLQNNSLPPECMQLDNLLATIYSRQEGNLNERPNAANRETHGQRKQKTTETVTTPPSRIQNNLDSGSNDVDRIG